MFASRAKSATAETAIAIGAAFLSRHRNNTSANESELSGSKNDRLFILLLPLLVLAVFARDRQAFLLLLVLFESLIWRD